MEVRRPRRFDNEREPLTTNRPLHNDWIIQPFPIPPRVGPWLGYDHSIVLTVAGLCSPDVPIPAACISHDAAPDLSTDRMRDCQRPPPRARLRSRIHWLGGMVATGSLSPLLHHR